MRRIPVILLAGLLFANTVAAQAPVPVAERITLRRTLSIRVTLFSNGMVVLTGRDTESDTQVFMRQTLLDHGDLMVYISMLEEDVAALDPDEPVSSDVATSESEVTLVLHVGPDAPRLLRFSPVATMTMPLARIMGVLDDLHQQVLAASPSEETLRDWVPRRGDRVQLLTGEYAQVREIWEEGLVVLECEGTYLRVMVLPGRADEVILRVVETAR